MESEIHTPDFRTLFESAPGLYLVLSPDLKIVAVSDAYVEATLTKRNEIIGRGIFDVFPDNPDDPAATGVGNLRSSLLRAISTKAPDAMAVQRYDIPRPVSEGGGFEERFWSPLNTPVIGKDQEVKYIIHRVEDVTEFIRLKQQGSEQSKLTEELRNKAGQMESEIFRRAQELQEANARLREAEKVKSDFFANVSHELRTPLSLILAPVESILSGKHGDPPESQRRLLHTAHNNSVRLLQLVNGLLDFAKFEGGKMRSQREPIAISSIIRMIVNDFESMLRSKHIKLDSRIEIEEQKVVMMDRYLLERILFNLLSNAAKFTSDGGTVSVSASLNKEVLSISVKDTGIGISQHAIPLLFQKFRQVEGSSTRRFEGTGLGLAMVKEFSELLGGSVFVESEVGIGSTFAITIPTQVTHEKPDSESTADRKILVPLFANEAISDILKEPRKDTGMKVLVCEDNPELANYIGSLIEDIAEVRIVGDGEKGIAEVRLWKPDLVLSDVMMPKKDGITLCRELKSNPETVSIVIVLLTAMTHREAMIKGWEAGADEYLFKPFHPEEMLTRIRTLLSAVRDRKRSVELLGERNAQLVHANADLESFSYSVSHDLRSPLRSIGGFTAMLEEDYGNAIGEEGRKTIKAIQSNVNRMNRLIDDLLEFSKLDKKELRKESIDMYTLVQGILTELKGSNHSAIIEMASLPEAKADPNLMRQVWLNLLLNAIKYSSKKEAPIIEVGCERKGDFSTYFVKDNGVGFKMEYADKLFGVFQRLHKPSEFEGTGVGLALVKRIVDKHGGRVWAEAMENQGATFYFSLPANGHQ